MFDREKEKPRMDNNPNAASAFLGPGSKITGTIKLDSTGRIEGEVEGEIHARDLVIGESAVVKAQINGATVVVHGTVVGDIRATSRLEIRRPAKVKGNISSSVLVIEEGASFEGKVYAPTAGGGVRELPGAAPVDPRLLRRRREYKGA